MRADVSRRERKFLEAYQETLNLAESARRAGYHCNSVQSYSETGRRILNRFELSMPETLKVQGVTDELLAETVLNGLKAKKKLFASYEGVFTDEREVDDHSARAKFVELAGRMKGAFIDRVQHEGKDGGDIVLQLSPRVPQRSTKKEIEFDE